MGRIAALSPVTEAEAAANTATAAYGASNKEGVQYHDCLKARAVEGPWWILRFPESDMGRSP